MPCSSLVSFPPSPKSPPTETSLAFGAKMRKVTLWSAATSVDLSVSLGVRCLAANWASARGSATEARDSKPSRAPERKDRDLIISCFSLETDADWAARSSMSQTQFGHHQDHALAVEE